MFSFLLFFINKSMTFFGLKLCPSKMVAVIIKWLNLKLYLCKDLPTLFIANIAMQRNKYIASDFSINCIQLVYYLIALFKLFPVHTSAL